jgi:protein tyrosine/serine phosphatase
MPSFFRNVCRAAVTILISGILCAGGPPQAEPNSPSKLDHGRAKKLNLTGVANFGEVTPWLYRGAQPSREGFEGLAAMGIEIVVDARLSGKSSENKVVNAAGMQYVSIPWHCMFPKDKAIAQFLTVLRDNPKKKIFVHCRYGDDRTGMMIAAYRMAVENWTAQEAWTEMQQFGMNRKICFPLISYERRFPEHLKKNPGLRGTVMAQQ